MSACCCKLAVGAVLHGFCGGAFWPRSYKDKRVEAVGADWVVAREASGSEALFYSGPLEYLLPWLAPEEENRMTTHTDNKPCIVCEPPPVNDAHADSAKQNAALRECVAYARSKRGKDFDFDTWEAMCEAAMAGEQAPSALENEIALHAQTRDALIAVRKERDALLVDTCHGAMCGKCLLCRVRSIHGCPARPNAKLKQP